MLAMSGNPSRSDGLQQLYYRSCRRRKRLCLPALLDHRHGLGEQLSYLNALSLVLSQKTNVAATKSISDGVPMLKRSKQMFKHPVVLTTIGLIAAITSQATAQVPSRTKVGTLNCQLAPSTGFIVGSHDPMKCRYTPEGSFPHEFYDGVITTVGLDIGFKTGGELAWAVIAPTVGPPRGGLAGEYLGASASVTAGGGAGANVLIGGSQRSFVLQPLSIQGQTGLDLTLGVSGLELRSVR
jgi:hypothetical protein